MSLQGDPGESHGASEAVGHPGDPTVLAVTPRKNGGNGKRCNGVAGRKAGILAERRSARFGPRIGKISIGRDVTGAHPATRVFQQGGEHFCVHHRFTRQQGGVLGIRIMARDARHKK